MISCLLEKEIINNFLNKYPNNQWSQVIPALVQLGLIHLYDNYNPNLNPADLTYLVETILRDKYIKPNNNNNNQQQPPRGRQMKPEPHKNEYKREIQSAKSPGIKWEEKLRKPSSEWRNGDDEIFDRSLSKVRDIYSTDSSK